MHAIPLDSVPSAHREWLLANAAFLPGYLATSDGRACLLLLIEHFANYVGEHCASDNCAD